jgi:hypothetical protein
MTLASRIADHRALYAADLHIPKLVSRQPPTTLDLNTGQLHVEDGTRSGMTISGRLLKYLGHPEGYGADFPWSRAHWLSRHWCRRSHEFHRAADRPYWRGSLCHQLVRFVIIEGWSVQNTAKILRYDHPEPVLRGAFDFIEQTIDDARDRAEKRRNEELGHGPGAIPVAEAGHHAPSEEHVRECPNPVCKARRAA